MQSDSWQVYQRLIDDLPGTAYVDTSWASEGPASSMPRCVMVRIAYESNDETCIPDTSEELEALQAMTKALTSQLGRGRACRHLGTLSHNLVHSLYLYVDKADDAESTVKTALASFKGRAIETLILNDPEWTRVVEEVWPTETEVRWNDDLSVLEDLEEAGDDMTTPRAIEHVAFFPSEEAAEQFTDWVLERGYHLTETDEDEDENDEIVEVAFEKEAVPDLESIFEQTSELVDAAIEFGGEYDGWTCLVVRDGDADDAEDADQ